MLGKPPSWRPGKQRCSGWDSDNICGILQSFGDNCGRNENPRKHNYSCEEQNCTKWTASQAQEGSEDSTAELQVTAERTLEECGGS